MNEFLNFYYLIDLFLLIIMIIPSNLYKFHPLIFSMMLFLYTLILSIKINYFLMNFWYSYILFLIMVGGVMILIMYFTSISSNELLNYSLKFFIYLILKILFLMFIIYMMILNFKYINLMLKNFELLNFLKILFDNNYLINKNLYMKMNLDISIFFIIYLLLMMMFSTIICMKFNIPMRQMIF